MRAARGFTLVEALIALLILTSGLLALGSMQLKALQGAHMGYQRSLINLMAIDAQERVWAGRAGGACIPVSQVNAEWFDHWNTQAALHLVAVDTRISSPAACEYHVNVRWEEPRSATNNGGDPIDTDSNEFLYMFRLPD